MTGCGFNHGGRGVSRRRGPNDPGRAPFWWFVGIAFGLCAILNILKEQGVLT